MSYREHQKSNTHRYEASKYTGGSWCIRESTPVGMPTGRFRNEEEKKMFYHSRVSAVFDLPCLSLLCSCCVLGDLSAYSH
jgi:hypothetical protein